ncbi:MAG: PAS domain S-box protein [Gemmatimonadota bacterium]|nr:PAS domain S-box protein [Gemmatimonadota bacterium]
MSVSMEQGPAERPLLLIEDNPADVDLVREYLSDVEEESPRIETAGSLSEARAMLDGGRFRAVLLDLDLPDSNGLETLDRVLAEGPHVPVIVLTGGVGDGQGREAVRRGAADFLPKDELSGKLLLRSIRYAIERGRRQYAEAQYRALVENSRDLVSILEHDLTIRYVSPSLRRVLGYRPEEKQGADGALEVHPDDRGLVFDEVARLLEDPTYASHFKYRVRHKDGSWRHLDTIAQNCFDDPHIRGFVVSSRDVTELHETRQEAAATARRLERTLGALEDAVFTVEPEGRTIVHCNAAAESMFGYRAEEMVGRSTRLLHVDEASFQRFHDESVPALREKGGHRTEFRMRTKDGRAFPVEVTVSLLDPRRGLDGGRGERRPRPH